VPTESATTKSDWFVIRGSILGLAVLYAAWIPMKLYGFLPDKATWFMALACPAVCFHAFASLSVGRVLFGNKVVPWLGYVFASIALMYLVLAIAGAPMPFTASQAAGHKSAYTNTAMPPPWFFPHASS
jgi:hypothetical protein